MLQEDINFLLTNRIPRQLATRLLGRFSRLENPLLARSAIALWRLFADLDLSESQLQRFDSLHACFTRKLKPGARPVDRDPRFMISPCDGVVGACGPIRGHELIQVKGLTYTLAELLVEPRLVERLADGQFVTLRLTSSMYHRFHAPHDCTVERVTFIRGDTWNVNPIALKRVAKLFCKNERAIVETVLRDSGSLVTLVPVGAILVASIRLGFLDAALGMGHRGGVDIPCRASFEKGEEVGWFELGSTIIVLAPKGFAVCDAVREGVTIRMGERLMRLP